MSSLDSHLLARSGLLSCLNFLRPRCSFSFSILLSTKYFSPVWDFRHLVPSPPRLPPAQRLLSGCAERMVGAPQRLFGAMLPPEEAPVPGPGSARDLHTAQRTWRMEEGKGHFLQVWGLPGVGSSRRPNPDRVRRVAQPRDQSHVPMSAAAPPPLPGVSLTGLW